MKVITNRSSSPTGAVSRRKNCSLPNPGLPRPGRPAPARDFTHCLRLARYRRPVHPETGQALDLSETAVKTRLLRARLRLRDELSLYYGEGLNKRSKNERK